MKLSKPLASVKRIAIFLLTLLIAVVIVACQNGDQVPYGNLSDDKNNPYLKIGDYLVTEKELYNQLRTSSTSRFAAFVDEIVFKDELTPIKQGTQTLDSFQVKVLEKEINTALFSSTTTTRQAIAALPDRTRAQRIISYADSFAITNPGIDKEALIEFLEDVVDRAVTRASEDDYVVENDANEPYGYYDPQNNPEMTQILVNQYALVVAQKTYAKEQLGDINNEKQVTGEMADKDSSVYVSESHIVSQYKSNIAGRYEVNALIIEFASAKEHEIARYKYAIKSNSRGEWYRIPNISDPNVVEILKTGSSHELWAAPYQKALDILTKPVSEGGLGKVVDANFEPIDYRTPDFATYYSKYTINNATDSSLEDSMEYNEVLWTFLKIYDDLNGTTLAPDLNQIGTLAAGQTKRTELEELFKYEYNSNIFKNNTALRSYVYGLDKESLWLQGQDEDGNKYSRPYSRQVQTFGSNPYLVYLLNDNREVDEDVLDDSDPEDVHFKDNENAQAVREKALKQLIENRLTDAYVQEKIKEKYEEGTIDIYDPIIREFYAKNYTYKGSYSFLDNDTLAMVNGTKVTVREYFNKVEETLGLSTALDLVLMKKLRVEYKDELPATIKEDSRKEFETQYVNPFLANSYESAGFPASMGLEKFLLLGFGAYAHDGMSATEDAIDKVYVQTKLREAFEADYAAHYDDIYEKFEILSKRFYNESAGLTASHLLIYVDFDGDGNPDDPTKVNFAELNLKDPNDNPITDLEDFQNVVEDLITVITNRAKLKSTMSEGLNAVITAYGDATRYELTYNALDPYREDVWTPYKRLGIQLKFESLGEITNQKNFPSNQSTYDVRFFDYAYAMALHLKNEIEALEDGEAPTAEEKTARANALLPLYGPELQDSDFARANFSADNIRSGFGWHLLLATGYSQLPSAKLVLDADPVEDPDAYAKELEDYTSEVKDPNNPEKFLDATNSEDTLSWKQILIYLEESKEETGVVTLPTSVQSAITKYFTPINTAYQNSYSKLEVAFQYLLGDGNLSGALGDRLTVLRDANINQFYGYSYFKTIPAGSIYEKAYNAEFAAVYHDWFEVLKGTVNN